VSIAPDTHSWIERNIFKRMGMAPKFRRKFKVRVGFGFAWAMVIFIKRIWGRQVSLSTVGVYIGFIYIVLSCYITV